MTFKILSKFVLNLLSLPHLNADNERLFSQVNLIKTKIRNKVVISTVTGVLLAKQSVTNNDSDCTTYEP